MYTSWPAFLTKPAGEKCRLEAQPLEHVSPHGDVQEQAQRDHVGEEL